MLSCWSVKMIDQTTVSTVGDGSVTIRSDLIRRRDVRCEWWMPNRFFMPLLYIANSYICSYIQSCKALFKAWVRVARTCSWILSIYVSKYVYLLSSKYNISFASFGRRAIGVSQVPSDIYLRSNRLKLSVASIFFVLTFFFLSLIWLLEHFKMNHSSLWMKG